MQGSTIGSKSYCENLIFQFRKNRNFRNPCLNYRDSTVDYSLLFEVDQRVERDETKIRLFIDPCS